MTISNTREDKKKWLNDPINFTEKKEKAENWFSRVILRLFTGGYQLDKGSIYRDGRLRFEVIQIIKAPKPGRYNFFRKIFRNDKKWIDHPRRFKKGRKEPIEIAWPDTLRSNLSFILQKARSQIKSKLVFEHWEKANKYFIM